MPYLSPADKPALLPGPPAAPLLSPHSSQQGLPPRPPLVFGAIHAYVWTGAGSRAAADPGAVCWVEGALQIKEQDRDTDVGTLGPLQGLLCRSPLQLQNALAATPVRYSQPPQKMTLGTGEETGSKNFRDLA